MDEELEPKELSIGGGQPTQSTMTLQQAIEFGEYDPKHLANFAEWHALSTHIQWQLVRKALDIRFRQLMSQYAELANVLDFTKKPNIQAASRNVERQLKVLDRDRERLYVEYSNMVG